MLKKIGYFILALVLLLGVVSFIFIQNNKPKYKGTVSIESLDEEVSVYFDDVGVPHIFADNEIDAYRALGYVHAQDRLWQMELIRRIAAGRLAEIFGTELVKTDKFFRGLGTDVAANKAICRSIRWRCFCVSACEALMLGHNLYKSAGFLLAMRILVL